MSRRMLIDATHAEETRVVVVDGNRLEDFDYESATKKQLKGNKKTISVYVCVYPHHRTHVIAYRGHPWDQISTSGIVLTIQKKKNCEFFFMF